MSQPVPPAPVCELLREWGWVFSLVPEAWPGNPVGFVNGEGLSQGGAARASMTQTDGGQRCAPGSE